jgi:nucleoside 2-deoxyribosyltransferase
MVEGRVLKMKVYVASSWRNQLQPAVVAALREAGHDVNDFKNPAPGNNGFHWPEIDENWQAWTPEQLREAHKHPIAEAGFKLDMDALTGADACVLVMPSGRSAHIEAGYAVGAGKPTCILLAEGEPELMYKMAHTVLTIEEAVDYVNNCCRYETKFGFLVPVLDCCAHRASTGNNEL